MSILSHQVIEIGSDRRVIRNVYRDTGVPTPKGSYVIYDGGWKRVKRAKSQWFLLARPK